MFGNFSLGNTIFMVIVAVAVIVGIVLTVRALLGHPRKRHDR